MKYINDLNELAKCKEELNTLFMRIGLKRPHYTHIITEDLNNPTLHNLVITHEENNSYVICFEFDSKILVEGNEKTTKIRASIFYGQDYFRYYKTSKSLNAEENDETYYQSYCCNLNKQKTSYYNEEIVTKGSVHESAMQNRNISFNSELAIYKDNQIYAEENTGIISCRLGILGEKLIEKNMQETGNKINITTPYLLSILNRIKINPRNIERYHFLQSKLLPLNNNGILRLTNTDLFNTIYDYKIPAFSIGTNKYNNFEHFNTGEMIDCSANEQLMAHKYFAGEISIEDLIAHANNLIGKQIKSTTIAA